MLVRTNAADSSCDDYSFHLAAFVIPLSIDYNMGDLSYLHVEKPKYIPIPWIYIPVERLISFPLSHPFHLRGAKDVKKLIIEQFRNLNG